MFTRYRAARLTISLSFPQHRRPLVVERTIIREHLPRFLTLEERFGLPWIYNRLFQDPYTQEAAYILFKYLAALSRRVSASLFDDLDIVWRRGRLRGRTYRERPSVIAKLFRKLCHILSPRLFSASSRILDIVSSFYTSRYIDMMHRDPMISAACLSALDSTGYPMTRIVSQLAKHPMEFELMFVEAPWIYEELSSPTRRDLANCFRGCGPWRSGPGRPYAYDDLDLIRPNRLRFQNRGTYVPSIIRRLDYLEEMSDDLDVRPRHTRHYDRNRFWTRHPYDFPLFDPFIFEDDYLYDDIDFPRGLHDYTYDMDHNDLYDMCGGVWPPRRCGTYDYYGFGVSQLDLSPFTRGFGYRGFGCC